MTYWQKIIVLFWAIFSFTIFLKGFNESNKKENAYGLTPFLFIFGIFVWGDATVFGIFWFLASITTLLLNDWILFLLVFSVFWVVRSLGETIYWFNQQFSKVIQWPPEKLPFFKFFHNDSIWFVYQIVNQCITVVSIIVSIYLTKLWLK